MVFMIGGLAFRTSEYSGDEGNCVAVAEPGNGDRVVLDSKDLTGPQLTVTGPAWAAFTSGIRDGEFD
jgi:hypothetical protein